MTAEPHDEHRAISPIPTRYSGVLFRSKLEARWAVFFDRLSIPWAYEVQGFDVDGRAYLPDFLLPEQWLWAEVKPAWDTDPDGVARWRAFIAARGERGVLLTDMWPRPGEFLVVGANSDGSYWEHDGSTWLSCASGYHFDLHSMAPIGCTLCPENDGYWYGNPRISEALDRARSHRFAG